MTTPATEGVVLVDKPAGMTSHDVVAVARRALMLRRIGHAGTLDPFATGLLVLVIGRATRLVRFLDLEPKVYQATVRFGAETATDDATGAVTRTAPPPDRQAVDRALPSLTGCLMQVPPAYSAKQVGGRRAYDAARRGEPISLAPTAVTVHGWQLTAWHGDAMEATITCSGGTYVRALARDLGRLAGSAAHLGALRRLRCGRLDVRDAASLAALQDGHAPLHPTLSALPPLPLERLVPEDAGRVAHGMAVAASQPGERAGLVDESGALIALAERVQDRWQPRVVLRDA
ncbi:MAG TPA: tRNA pseudouridine(55) synthase TruB [Gemmatimonadaceae bacterium]|nr:tRNA pseudouridine(55) synthase TruB [Gemmatimonadaceae bacterium]